MRISLIETTNVSYAEVSSSPHQGQSRNRICSQSDKASIMKRPHFQHLVIFLLFGVSPASYAQLATSVKSDSVSVYKEDSVGLAKKALYQDAIPYMLCQTKPTFNGGTDTATGRSDTDFAFWVIQHMEVEEPYRISGRVTVRVLLSEEGEILDIDDIGRTPNTYLSAAFIRTMKTAPKWTPGYHNGKPCKVLMTIPAQIDFR